MTEQPNSQPDQVECDSCLESDEHRAATTRSTNPAYSGYRLCAECAAEYDSRPYPLTS